MIEKIFYNQSPETYSDPNEPLQKAEADNLTELPQAEKFNERLSDFFRSGEFVEFIEQIADFERERAIGVIIDYNVLHRDGFMFPEFQELLRNHGPRDDYAISNFYVDSIAKKLKLEDVDSEDSKEQIWRYFHRNCEKNGFCFHGFNGAFEDSIKKIGLTRGERLWSDLELERIREIGDNHGTTMLLGWHGINSSQNLFYDASPRNVYQYGSGSPEWFNQFVGGGFHMSVKDKAAKSAFLRRDYDQARHNIEDLCQRWSSNDEELIRQRRAYPNLTIEERVEIIGFFEKFWLLLAGEKSKPKAALIKKSVLGQDDIFAADYEVASGQAGKSPSDPVRQVIKFVMQAEYSYVDLRTREDIRPQDFLIVDLPEYNRVFGKKKA